MAQGRSGREPGGGPAAARVAMAAELVGHDAVMDRLLSVAREELGFEVTFLAGPRLPPPPADGPYLDLPVLRSAGSQAGVLRFVLPVGTDPATAKQEASVRILGRFISEQLRSWDRAYRTWQEQTDRIRQILASGELDVVYQPIADLRTGEVVGVEALARFPDPPGHPPNLWFAEAAAVGLSVDLEVLAVRTALPALELVPADAYLAVNLSPVAAMSRELVKALESQPLDRVVVEITEHAQIDDYEELNRALQPLRGRGLRVAVDDTGSGFASLRHILEMSPDIIKLDTSLTHGIDNDSVLRALAFSISSFASAIDATVVAEGVETESELDALRFLHVACGQGFYLGRPRALPKALELAPVILSPSSPV